MGWLDFLFGRKNERSAPQPASGRVSFGEGPIRFNGSASAQGLPGAAPDEYELALQRYRYMLRTAPPETIEQAHAEAFAQMTPEQRAYVLQALSAELPEAERTRLTPADSEPQPLARVATRAELRNPGTVERVLEAAPAGPGMLGGAGALAGTLLMSFAAGFAGSMVAAAFFNAVGDPFAAAGDMASELPMAEADFGDFGGFDGGFEEI
ncbi:MAG: hypothetical protein N2378_13650 [Chloroflexaceae bacterium]|nr:hypothetical protein [Chloroflexaceae bacterium]